MVCALDTFNSYPSPMTPQQNNQGEEDCKPHCHCHDRIICGTCGKDLDHCRLKGHDQVGQTICTSDITFCKHCQSAIIPPLETWEKIYDRIVAERKKHEASGTDWIKIAAHKLAADEQFRLATEREKIVGEVRKEIQECEEYEQSCNNVQAVQAIGYVLTLPSLTPLPKEDK